MSYSSRRRFERDLSPKAPLKCFSTSWLIPPPDSPAIAYNFFAHTLPAFRLASSLSQISPFIPLSVLFPPIASYTQYNPLYLSRSRCAHPPLGAARLPRGPLPPKPADPARAAPRPRARGRAPGPPEVPTKPRVPWRAPRAGCRRQAGAIAAAEQPVQNGALQVMGGDRGVPLRSEMPGEERPGEVVGCQNIGWKS